MLIAAIAIGIGASQNIAESAGRHSGETRIGGFGIRGIDGSLAQIRGIESAAVGGMVLRCFYREDWVIHPITGAQRKARDRGIETFDLEIAVLSEGLIEAVRQ